MTLASRHAREEVTPLDLAGEAAGRCKMVEVSPAFFATYYLGLDCAMHQARWYSLFMRHKRLLLLAPRDHGKTEALVRVFAESRICSDRSVRVLVISKTKDESRKRVDQVRRDLEGNSKILEDFGGFAPRVVPDDRVRRPGRPKAASTERWSSTQFYVTGRKSSRDATMESVGVGGAITGGHFDLIILDDPIELNDARSQSNRDSVWQWFQGTVLKLVEPWTKVIVIGTRKHADDLYGRIIAGDGRFEVVTDRAIPDESWLSRGEWKYLTRKGEGGRVVTYGVQVVGERTEPLWPERWSLENLLLEYKESSLTFMRESQNRMMDDAKTVFKRAYFTGGTVESLPGIVLPGCYEPKYTLSPPGAEYRPHPALAHLHILQAWDLSLVDSKEKAERDDSDFMVGLTIGYDPSTEERWLLGFYRDRGVLPSQVTGAIKLECARFGGGGQVRFVAVERNAFGRLHELKLRATTALPLVGHTTGKNKADPDDGVFKLVGLLENGKWRIPTGDLYSRQVAQLVENEFVGYGVESHDDIVLASWIAECLVARYERFLFARGSRGASGASGAGVDRGEMKTQRPSVGVRPSRADA